MNEDQNLIDRIKRGEQQAFTEFVSKHQKLVFHIVSRLIDRPEDREDLCQEVFIKVFRKIHEFRFESKLSTWVASIAYRMSVNDLKKHKKYQETDLEKVALVHENHELPADRYIDRQQLHRHIHQMIQQLPLHYRSILTLYHLEEMPYHEIAQVSGKPEGTVKNYLFRARKLLKEMLEKHYIKEELR
ncbi:MAG: RNA polymerase sigma factor [Cyclobacteriaceae bacterium]